MHEAPRYLQYETAAPVVAGLEHQISNLRCLLHEAHATGRLAVLPPLRLCPTHNLGVDRDWNWELYFALGESRLVDAEGRKHPLPLAARLPPAGVRTLTLRPREHMPSQARDYPLVVRRHKSHVFRLPAGDWAEIELWLCPSARVLELARPVVGHIASLDDGRFAAVHVRRGDRVRRGGRIHLHNQYPARLTEPAHIRGCLKEQGVADGSVVYILSDERCPNFWKPLKERYRLIRYVDFPRLNALISLATTPPDNYLLYAVEREVMRSASVKIETLPGRGSDIHGFLVRKEDFTPTLPRVLRPLPAGLLRAMTRATAAVAALACWWLPRRLAWAKLVRGRPL